MKNITSFLILLNLLLFNASLLGIAYNRHQHEVAAEQAPVREELVETPLKERNDLPPIQNTVKNPNPHHGSYDEKIALLSEWAAGCPEMTSLETYGKSKGGRDLYCFRINNKRINKDKPRVMVVACIHGNETWAADTTMCYIGNLLEKYGKDENITQLLDERDLYFVPVVSPDSFTLSRYVEGVDPNRDFTSQNHQSCTVISALEDLFQKVKPKAVLSCHTWGRVFLTPYGDTMEYCPDHKEIQRVASKMGELASYNVMRTCELYKRNGLNVPPVRDIYQAANLPIYGSENDWFYRNGAVSMVMEMGEHQRIPTYEEITGEFNRTFSAVLCFIKEAPLIQTHPSN